MICSICSKITDFAYCSRKYGVLCENCAYLKLKRQIIVCNICKKISPKKTNRENQICGNCYNKTYLRKKFTCIKCGKNNLISLKDGICTPCYKKEYIATKRTCVTCGKNSKIHANNVCEKCYIRPKKKCDTCGNIETISKIENNISICKVCYKVPSDVCSVCKKIKEVCYRKDKIMCRSCYSKQYVPPIKICSICKKHKPIQKRFNNDLYCKICWEKHRMKTDDLFYVKTLLRSRLRDAFKKYSQGKCYTSSKYGINYQDIFDYIGKCPGKREKYNIDHIFPLSIFDLNNMFEIWAAFHPHNHQWLLRECNISKSNNYDKEKYLEYMKKMKNMWNKKIK